MKSSKACIVNFELIWDICDDPYPATYKLVMDDIKKAAAEGCNVIVGILIVEGLRPYINSSFDDLITQINIDSKKLGIDKVILISGLLAKSKYIKSSNQIIFVDVNLLALCSGGQAQIESDTTFEINKGFLFLVGNPARNNRIGLMSRLYDKQLLENNIWSFTAPSSIEDQDTCRKICQKYTDEQYTEFLNNCQRSIDSLYKEYAELQNENSLGNNQKWLKMIEIDFTKVHPFVKSDIFAETSFSIISEGINHWSDEYSYITEKTWRPILHKHAFIFAGHPDQYRYIKSLGLKTFEEYLLIPDYAYIKDEEERLDAVVKNVEYFLAHHHKFEMQIKKDTEHNFKILLEHKSKLDKILKVLNTVYGVPESEIEYWLKNPSLSKLIRTP